MLTNRRRMRLVRFRFRDAPNDSAAAAPLTMRRYPHAIPSAEDSALRDAVGFDLEPQKETI